MKKILHMITKCLDSINRKNKLVVILISAAAVLMIALFLEGTLCNINYYRNLLKRDNTVSEKDYQVVYNDQDILQKNGTFTISEPGEHSIEYKGIDTELFNIYIQADQSDHMPVEVKIGVKDESYSNRYFYGPISKIFNQVEVSQYINLSPGGKVKDVIITFIVGEDRSVTIYDTGFNKVRPFQFLWGRVAAIWMIGMFAFLFWYRKKTYQIMYHSKKRWQKLVIYGIMIAQMIFCTWIVNTSYQYEHSQLNELADSLMKGKLSLDRQFIEELPQLDNPYDISQREGMWGSIWDESYYDGKVYVYFGILPVLLLYLPAKLLFDITLSTNQVILTLVFSIIIMSKVLLDQIVRVWFKRKVPFLPYLLCLIAFMNASGILWNLRRPNFYEIYGPASLLMVMLGLSLWLSSIHNNGVRMLPLTAGSFCMALVAGCRPNCLLYSVLAIPLFWEAVFTKLKKPAKQQVIQLLGMFLPYFIVGVAIMAYNYARFDSVFEFGNHYQLTVADMRYSFALDKLPFGLWWYYLAIPVINNKFPFIYPPHYVPSYQGQYYIDGNSMGTMFMNLILLFLFCLPKMKVWMKQQKKGLYGFCLTGMITAFIQSCIIVVTGGIHQRYMMDFVPIYLITAIVIIFSMLVKYYKTNTYQILNKILLVCFAGTMLFQLVNAIRSEGNQLMLYFPKIYYTIERAVEFWL